jgi:hypothetical protein
MKLIVGNVEIPFVNGDVLRKQEASDVKKDVGNTAIGANG